MLRFPRTRHQYHSLMWYWRAANERDDNGADGDRKNIRVFKGPSEYLEREFGKLFPCVKTFHSQYHMQRNGKP